MSLMYKLFGKPQSIGELFDKAKKKNIREIDVSMAEVYGMWIMPARHSDIPRFASFIERRSYTKNYLVALFGEISYVENMGDMPLYGNLGFKLAEKVAVEIRAVKLAGEWYEKGRKNDILLKLPFDTKDCEKIISELKAEKEKFEKMGLRYQSRHRCSKWDTASSNAAFRIAMPEEYVQIQRIFNQSLFGF